MNAEKTEIIVVLDRSGSMVTIAHDMRGGFDTYMKDQQKLSGECVVTLCQFDEQYDVVYEAKSIADVPPLELVPRGWTALYDAIGKTITSAGERFRALLEEERPGKVLFVIITDGMENSSKEWKQAAVKEAIERQTAVYKWEFVFFGANQDAVTTGAGLGIRAANSVTYTACSRGVEQMSSVLSAGTTNYRGGGASAWKKSSP